jgi:hypothetical protein
MAVKNSIGTVFSVETATAGTYVAIDGILDIPSILGDKAGKIDVTSLDDEEYKQYIRDLKDAIEITVNCNWTGSAAQLRLQTLDASGALAKFKLVLPDAITPSTGTGTTIVRDGYVAATAIMPAKSSQLKFSFTVQFSGAPTITAAN